MYHGKNQVQEKSRVTGQKSSRCTKVCTRSFVDEKPHWTHDSLDGTFYGRRTLCFIFGGNHLRKTIGICMLVLASCIFMVAQDSDTKAEVFGGYQWTSVDFGSGVSRQNFNGFDGAVTGYFNKNVGITADFSGNYKTIEGASTKIYTYTFGPTFRVPMDKATPFVHALFGGAHAAAGFEGASASSSGFAYAFGGGLDVNASKNVAIRIAQFDYFGTRIESTTQNNFRYSAGIVFKF